MSLSTSAIMLGTIVWVAQQSSPSVWDGVYTVAQAERGRIVYERHCNSCHGDDLAARGSSPLAGAWVLLYLASPTVERLFSTIPYTKSPPSAVRLRVSNPLPPGSSCVQRNGLPPG